MILKYNYKIKKSLYIYSIKNFLLYIYYFASMFWEYVKLLISS